MARNPFRKSQLIEFDNAAAGHAGVLLDKSEEFLIKPCKEAEIAFYETALQHPEFAYYMPVFFGILSLNEIKAEAFDAISPALPPQPSTPIAAQSLTAPPTWTPSRGQQIKTNTAIVVENVTSRFKKPNVLDVKLGTRLWGDDAPLVKRQKLDKVSQETTSGSLGLRIAGMRTWMGSGSVQDTNKDGFKCFNKDFGRNLTTDTIQRGFEDFFFVESAGVTMKLGRRIIKRFLGDLRGLREVVENEQSRMFSASLLFVYEGDGRALADDFVLEKQILQDRDASNPINGDAGNGDIDIHSENEEEGEEVEEDGVEGSRLPKIQVLKVIDFAYANWTPGQGPDENLLKGLRRVIEILEAIVA